MITLLEKIQVNRPVAEAFAYVADFRTTEQWDSTVISARKLGEGAIAVGTRFEVICRQPLGSVTLQYTLTRLEPDQLIALHGSSRFFDVDDEIRFTEMATGTQIDYRATFTFRAPLDRFAARFHSGLEQMGHESVQGLKRALDDDFPVPQQSDASRWGQKLVLPALAHFTRAGFNSGKKHWYPVSRWMADKHVVITGASAGLGLATAHRLAELGAELTLVIRDESKALPLKQAIERVSGNRRIHIEIADLSLITEVERLVRRLMRVGKPIDVLVNNLLRDERRQQHGEHQRSHHHLQGGARQQGQILDVGDQHEAELAAGAQPQSGAHGRAGLGAEGPLQTGNDDELAGQQQDQQAGDPGKLASDDPDVEKHADGDEKQPEQHVAERLDVLLHLVAVFRLGDQHAGKKGAQRQGQPGQFGEIGQAEGDQQHVEHE